MARRKTKKEKAAFEQANRERGLTQISEEEGRARAEKGTGGGIFTKATTGKPSGITLPGGRTFLGLGPQDVATIQQQRGLDLSAVGPKVDPARLKELRQAQAVQQIPEAPLEQPGILGQIGAEAERIEAGTLVGAIGQALTPGITGTEAQKVRGGIALAGGAIGAGAGVAVGLAAGGLTASTTAVSTATAQSTISTATTAAVSKGGLLSALWATKIGKAILIAGGAQAILDGAIGAYDTANSQFKENLPLIVKGVRNGAITPTEGMLQMNEIEEDLLRNERNLKLLSIFSFRAKLGKLQSAQNRIAKIRDELEASRQDLLIIAANPVPPDQEQLAIMLDELGLGGESEN